MACSTVPERVSFRTNSILPRNPVANCDAATGRLTSLNTVSGALSEQRSTIVTRLTNSNSGSDRIEFKESGSDSHPLLKIRDLPKRYAGIPIVDHVPFVIHRGETLGYLGRNGAGASLELRLAPM